VSLVRFGRLIALAAGASSLIGCFYLDPINRRPRYMGIERQCDASDPEPCDSNLEDLHRGDSVKLKAIFTDPDSLVSSSTFHWTVSTCDLEQVVCDVVYDGADQIAPFTVRSTLAATGGSVQSISVTLELFDDRGASITVSPKLTVHDGPTLVVSQSARSYTIGAPIEMFATYGDPDEGPPGTPPAGVAVQWTAIAPDGQLAAALIDLVVPQNPSDPGHITVGKKLIPQQRGAWDVRVLATDSHQQTNDKHLLFTIGPDLPPCLAQWAPISPPGGATLPVSAPTVFQVPLVDDDLDPYPPVSSDPLFGTTAFEWSIRAPGATARQRLVGATGNSVDFDPQAFTPGDVVELRVEVFDRNHSAVACADDEPVCPTSAKPGCNQRQTWRVEIR
jgi:hypothetical protein